MSIKTRGRRLFDRCMSFVLATVMLLTVANVDVLTGHADTTSNLHQHTFGCYDDYYTVCGLGGDSTHEHTAQCYQSYGDPMCGLEEGEPDHTHNRDGFECEHIATVLACNHEEHQHTSDCYKSVETTDETLGTTSEVQVPICGLEAHEHTQDCYKEIWKCRPTDNGIMYLGGGTYLPSLYWNINDSTMTPRDSSKQFVTWTNKSSASIAAIATVSVRYNVDVPVGEATITLPKTLYDGRDGNREGKLNVTSLQDVIGNTPFAIDSEDDTKVVLKNTQRIGKSNHVSMTPVYNINMVNTKDKTEFNSLKVEFDLDGDYQALTIGGQIDTGISSYSGYSINSKDYTTSENGRFYRWSDALQNKYGVTADQFKEIIDSGYVLVEHTDYIYSATKNQPAVFSMKIAPKNSGQLVALRQSNGEFAGVSINEGREGDLYTYEVTFNPERDYYSGNIHMLVKYPKNASLNPSDPNQLAVSSVLTLKLDGVDGEDKHEHNITTYHNSLLATPGYSGNMYHLWHSTPATAPAVLDSGLQVLSAGKDLEMQWYTFSSINYKQFYTGTNPSRDVNNPDFHTMEVWNDRLYMSDGLQSVYTFQPGDYSYTRLSFSALTDGEPYFDSSGQYLGTYDNDLAHKSEGGKYTISVITKDSPTEWVVDGTLNYIPNGSQSYTFTSKDVIGWKVSFDKAWYFPVVKVWAYMNIHGSSNNVKRIADDALNSGITGLDVMSWAGMGAHSNKEGSASQEYSVSRSEVTGDTSAYVHEWDALFWDKQGFDSSTDSYPQRWDAKQTVRSASMLATVGQANGVIDVNGKVTYGSSAATIASAGIRYDINAGLSFSTPFDAEQGRGMVEALQGKDTAIDSLTAVFYTLLPAGYELRETESRSPHANVGSTPSGYGPLANNYAGTVYANMTDTTSNPSYGKTRSQVFNNYRGSGQQLVKTTVTYDAALISKFAGRWNDASGTYYGVIFPLTLDASYTVGAAPTGTYYGHTLVEFLDSEGHPYDLSALASTNVFVDDGSAFSSYPNIMSIMSGVGTDKLPGHESDKTMLGVRSGILTNVTATVTGGQITSSSDSYPGWSSAGKGEADDEHYYWRMLYTNQTGSSDGVVLFTSLENGVDGKESTFNGVLDGIDTSYAESVGAIPRIFVNRNYIDKSKYLSSTANPNGISYKELSQGYDNWVSIDPKTFTDWASVKSVAVYFDKAGATDGFTFDKDTGWAYVVLKMKFPEGDNQLEGNKRYDTYNEMLVHAAHRDLNTESTTLSDSASMTVDTSYRGRVQEWVLGSGWTSSWNTLKVSDYTWPGDNYAYRISATVDSGRITDVVVFDNIENELDGAWNTNGTLKGIARITGNVGSAKFPFDIGAKLYVSPQDIDKEAYIANNYGVDYLNTGSDGWVLVQNPATYDNWDKVKSVAVSLGSYVLTKENGVTFALQMTAPTVGWENNKTSINTDTAFMTYRVAGASGKFALESNKVSIGVNLNNMAKVNKRVSGYRYDSDALAEQTFTGTSQTVMAGLPYHYVINGTAQNAKAARWMIYDDIQGGSFSGSTFVGVDGYVNVAGAPILDPAVNVYYYHGVSDPTSEGFWDLVNPDTLAKGIVGWNSEPSGAKAFVLVSDMPLYTDSANYYTAQVNLIAPLTGFTADETTSVKNTARLKYMTEKGRQWLEDVSNTTTVSITPRGSGILRSYVTAADLGGNFPENSAYSALAYPDHQYRYTFDASFNGVVWEPVICGDIESLQNWRGTLEGVEVTSTSVRKDGNEVTPLIYLSSTRGDEKFTGEGLDWHTFADSEDWVLYDESITDLSDYKAYYVVWPEAIAAQGSSAQVTLTMRAPKYDMAQDILNDAVLWYTVLGCDERTTRASSDVTVCPAHVYMSVTKTTLWEPRVTVAEDDEWRDDVSNNAESSEGLRPFWWGIHMNAVSVSGISECYSFVNDISLQDIFHADSTSQDNLENVILGVKTEMIPDEVPIIAYISEKYEKDLEIPEEDTLAWVRSNLTPVPRAEWETYDWSGVHYIYFYFGDDQGSYEWEVTPDYNEWYIFINVQPTWTYTWSDSVTHSTRVYSNGAHINYHSHKELQDAWQGEYYNTLPNYNITKKVATSYGLASDPIYTDYDAYGVIYEDMPYIYSLNLQSIGGEGGDDIVLIDSLEGLADSNIHGVLTGVDVSEFDALGIPTTIYGNEKRLTADEIWSAKDGDLNKYGYRDDRTSAEILSTADGWYIIDATATPEDWAKTKTIAVWLGNDESGAWWDDGRTIPTPTLDESTSETTQGGVNLYINMMASNLFSESEKEGVINEVYVARNSAYVHYRGDQVAETMNMGISGVNFIRKATEDLESEYSKTVENSITGTNDKGDFATSALGSDYDYHLKYNIKQGAANAAFGDTIEGVTGESGWHGTLQGVDVQSIIDAGYTPEVWVSEQEVDDWGKVFGDPATLQWVGPEAYTVGPLPYYEDLDPLIKEALDSIVTTTVANDGGVYMYYGTGDDSGFIATDSIPVPSGMQYVRGCVGSTVWNSALVTISGTGAFQFTSDDASYIWNLHLDGGSPTLVGTSGKVAGEIDGEETFLMLMKASSVLEDLAYTGYMYIRCGTEGNAAPVHSSILGCNHVYESGVCKYCGAEEPFTPPNVDYGSSYIPTASAQYWQALDILGTSMHVWHGSNSATLCNGQSAAVGTSIVWGVTPRTSGTYTITTGESDYIWDDSTSKWVTTLTVDLIAGLNRSFRTLHALSLNSTDSGEISVQSSITLSCGDGRWSKNYTADVDATITRSSHGPLDPNDSTGHTCERCGAKDAHYYGLLEEIDEFEHMCLDCTYSAPHTYEDTGDGVHCECSVCGRSGLHDWVDKDLYHDECSRCKATRKHAVLSSSALNLALKTTMPLKLKEDVGYEPAGYNVIFLTYEEAAARGLSYGETGNYRDITGVGLTKSPYGNTKTDVVVSTDNIFGESDDLNVYVYSTQPGSKIYLNTGARTFDELSKIKTLLFNDTVNTSYVGSMKEMFAVSYNSDDQLVLLDLSGFDTSRVSQMDGMFMYRRNLVSVNLSSFSTSSVTNMRSMFNSCSSLQSLDLSNFDTSRVTDMAMMFSGCSSLTSLDVSSFNTSSAIHMFSMFSSCAKLTSLSVSGFDTTHVTSAGQMFSGCKAIGSLDISNFNTSSMTDMHSMFNNCSSVTELDVSNFDTSKVTDFSQMFSGCTNVTSLDVSNFDTTKATTMRFIFGNCLNLTSLDLSNFDTSNVTDISNMFYECSKLVHLNLSSFDTSKATQGYMVFAGCSKLSTIIAPNFDITKFGTIDSMFHGCTSLPSYSSTKTDATYAKSIAEGGYFTPPATKAKAATASYEVLDAEEPMAWTGEHVLCSSDFTNRFSDKIEAICPNVTSIVFTDVEVPAGITATDVSENTYGDVMMWADDTTVYISSCDAGARVAASPQCDALFYGCSSLTSLDLSNFDTSNVTSMSALFFYCSSLTSLDLSGFDTSGVTDMSSMFYGCSSLTSLDLSSFNTSGVTNMNSVFGNCSGLTSLDLSNFDTSDVLRMDYMFCNCSGLTSLDLSGFNTSSVTDMNSMFYGCSSLTSLDLSSFDTSNILDMKAMFKWCSGLTSLDLSGFDTSGVFDVNGMFYDCSSLTSLDLSGFNTSQVEDMNGMFCECTRLTKITGSFDTSNVISSIDMFDGCTSLPNYDSTKTDASMAKPRTEGGYFWSDYTLQDVVDYAIDNDITYDCEKETGYKYVPSSITGVPDDTFLVDWISGDAGAIVRFNSSRHSSGLGAEGGISTPFVRQLYTGNGEADYTTHILAIARLPGNARIAYILSQINSATDVAMELRNGTETLLKESVDIQLQSHTFEDGVCTGCGLEKVYTKQDVMAAYLQATLDSVQPGTASLHTIHGLRVHMPSKGYNVLGLSAAITTDEGTGELVWMDEIDNVGWPVTREQLQASEYLYGTCPSDAGTSGSFAVLPYDDASHFVFDTGTDEGIFTMIEGQGYPLSSPDFSNVMRNILHTYQSACETLAIAAHTWEPLADTSDDNNVTCSMCGYKTHLDIFDEPSINQIDPWAGHTLGKSEDTYGFHKVPLDQLDSYDWSNVRSIAIRFSRNDEVWGQTDYFLEAPEEIEAVLHMKAPVDAAGTTGDLAYNRAVVWELDGKDFDHESNYTNLTTNRLLGWMEMPETGGSGTTLFYIVGGVSLLTAGAWLYGYKKKRRYGRANH